MLMPKRTKYRRPHRVSYEGKAKGGTTVTFGQYGLQSLEGAWITDRQIEAARIAFCFTFIANSMRTTIFCSFRH